MIKVNEHVIDVTLFPDRTSQVWKLPEEIFNIVGPITITWEFDSEAELMHLAQLKMLLDESFPMETSIRLNMTYLPYARQDKEISNKTTFALRTFAMIINNLNFDRVSVLDPHSDVAKSLINNLTVRYPTGINQVYTMLGHNIETAYADENAFNKYSGHPFNDACIYGKKVRDQLTGQITSYEVVLVNGPRLSGRLEPIINDSVVLIRDDICDGGGTFILLAKKLYDLGAKEVHLYTTHGIYSKGLRVLFDAGIKRVFNHKGEMFDYRGLVTYEEFP